MTVMAQSIKIIDGKMTPAQCRAARALLGWRQGDLAKAANLGISTVVDYECERRKVSDEATASIHAGLRAWGIEFNGGGRPGVRINIGIYEKAKRNRPRAATRR